jgi:predicted dehydrogenase
VCGSGGIARRRTIPEGFAAASNADLVAVFDLDKDVNHAVAAQFSAKAVDSLEGLLRLDLDAIYIATPVGAHYEQARRCAEAGRHVLCEKPLAMNVRECEDLVMKFGVAGRQLGTAFMMRFQSQHQAGLELVRSGQLGDLTYGRVQLSCWYPPIPGAWRQDSALGGGGALLDLGGHCIDLLELYFGPVARVSCLVQTRVHSYPVEDSAVALLQFESGALATVDTLFCVPDQSSKNALEIYGSRGSILATGTIGQGSLGEMKALLAGAEAGYDAQQDRGSSDGRPIMGEVVNVYRAEIEEFSQALIEGRESMLAKGAGLRSQKVLEACYCSAKTGRVAETR